MRIQILTAMVLFAGAPALASSIQPIVSSPGSGHSIVRITCTTCPAPKTREEVSGYRVPSLPVGTQEIEIRDVDGHKKVMRTEAWMGGSPVTYVSSAPIWLSEDKGVAIAEGELRQGGDGIDTSARTAAVGSGTSKPGIAAMAGNGTEPPTLDTSTFQLRLH